MAKKKYKKGDAQKGPKVNEANRKTITQLLKQFLLSNDEVFTFESNLSDRERAIVHLSCRKLGMKSKSSGRGQQRQVSVYKSTTKEDQKKSKVIPNLTFSDDSKEILHSLFTRYPPDDGDMLKEMMGKRSFETDKDNYGGDDFFHRPSMGNEEVLKKMESLASRMERAADLKKITAERSRLPIISYRDIITSTVESNQVVLISGETGCGKTTQVPQFLLDNMWGKGQACKIVCTQPRRISATSVAERISRERGENVGDDIGYKIRLESKGGRHSSVVFCTNGILLRVLVSKGIAKSKKRALKKNMNHVASQITHIIVDEIHERDRYSDFMLTIIRDMLPAFPHLRLILMSATIDAERFSHYFGGCPIIRVPGFTYPVKSFYLEDIISVLKTSSHNHIDNAALGVTTREQELSEEDKVALDKAIDSALSNDDYDVLLDLVSSGPSQVLNYQHSLTGVTPLMVFSGKGEVSNVCNLLTVGADCQLKDKDGFTALDWAERHNQREAAEVIRRHWESINSDSFQTQQLLNKYLVMVNPEQVDVILIEQVVWKICLDSQEGAILVFLPGWDDINSTRERLLNNQYFKDGSKFLVLSLHSMVPAAEQKKVFKRPPRGCRKIILSTNIAETAITIDDVVYVIDSGRMKEKSYDPYNNVSTLQSSWVSKASAKQREGRAGRCQPGMCYHLYSRERAASLPEFQVPEIKRTPVDELCLQVKLLDPNCSIDEFLRKTMDPPVPEAIRNAVAVLQEIGALSSNENLTILGEKLGSLPVHPLTSKMLLFAILMNCLDPALTLACASDYKDPFTLPMLPNQRYKADAAKRELSSLYGGYSDQLAVVAAFECWTNAKIRGQETRFCTDCFISPSTMRMIKSMRNQLLSELIRNGFIQEDISSCSLNARDPGILHAVLTSGLYPRVGKLVTGSRRRNQITVETANGENVRLVPHSIVSKLSFKGDNDIPLVLYDEITRGDWDLNIKNCSIVGPLPLIMIATDIAVAPSENIKGDDADGSKKVIDEDQSDLDKTDIENNSSGEKEERIMASPGNSVTVVVDRWLYFGLTALEIAQIYCLKERLSAAILFKVTHPRKVLPPVLGASVYAVACILSYDGLPRISSLSNSTGMMNSKEDGKSLKMFLRSLASHVAHGSSTSQNKHFNPPLFDSMAYRSDSRKECSGPPPYQNLPFPSHNPPYQQHKIEPLPLQGKFQAQQELQDWPPQDQKTEPIPHEGKPQAQQQLQQECPPPQDQKTEPPPHEGKPQGQQEQQECPPQDQKTEPLQHEGKPQALQEEQGCASQDQKTQPLPQIEQPKAKKKRRRPKKKPPVQQDPSPSLHLQQEQPVPSLNGCEPNSSRGDSLKRMRDELK